MLMAISMGPSSMRCSTQSAIQPTIRPTARPPSVRYARLVIPGDRRSLIPQHQGDTEFQSQQAGGVVHQALVLNQVSDPLGNSDTFSNGSGGERVRGCDDGAENQTEFPVEPGKEPVRTLRNPDHRESEQAKGQQQNAEQVEGEFT